MSAQRYISTSFWNDPWILDECTSDERYVYLYLLTSPNSNIAGVYELSMRTAELHTGYDREQLLRIMQRFGEAGKAHYFAGYVIIPKWPTHQRWQNREKIRVGIERILEGLPDDVLAKAREVGYEYPIPSDKVSIPSDKVSIPYAYESNYSDTDLDTDLDTDGKADARHAHTNRPMNQTTYNTLTASYGQSIVDDYFERVADYESSKGKRYKDHAATVRNWLKRDNVPKQSKPKAPPIRTRDFGKGAT